ncbi:MAG: diguanylate cyclase, partial [Gammaproteobacteria bacterium]|nr:diguanylate cyclase [Gammaproteobacteria bacterium]
SLLYVGRYDPILVVLSIAVAVFASYAATLVSQHAATTTEAKTRRTWLAVGGACMGLGIWAMHFVGMLALSLPCASGYDASLTLLSMLPSVLACTLALSITSRRRLSRQHLISGGLLFGGGIGAMHYAGMAAMRLEGLIRYDLGLFLLSLVVAVVLATFAIWIKFRLLVHGSQRQRANILSALTMGLAVSGMHYTAMAAAYFLREGDKSIVDSQIGATFLAITVLVATSVIVVVTLVASYVARPNLFSLGRSYRVVGMLGALWCGIAWLSADYYYEPLIDRLYQRELRGVNKDLDGLVDLLQDHLQRLKGIPQVFAQQQDIHKALRSFGVDVVPSTRPYAQRKESWSRDPVLGRISAQLALAADHLQADVIWVLNAAGDCVASSNHDQSDSFVGSNYSARKYYQQARAGRMGQQYAVGLISKLPGLYYSHPVMEGGRFLGAVVVKRNISGFSFWVDAASAFMTDANGVVVLAADRALQFGAMPAAPALGMESNQLIQQYGRTALRPLSVAAWPGKMLSSAVRMEGEEQPTLLVSRALADKLVTVHLTRSLASITQMRTEQYWLFALLAAAGDLLIIAASAVVLYLRESRRAEVDLRIAATAFEAQEGMVITDAQGVILRVNRAFTRLTGYSAEEVVGSTPRVLKSDRHDITFFRTLWDALLSTGSWQGEIWDRRKDGTVYPIWLTITAVKDKDGVTTHYVGMHADITQRKAAEEKIAHLAYYDPLTGLPNRRLLIDRLQQALANSMRSNQQGALLFIDLDNFKTLNDSMGHDIGDLLLKEVARRLMTCVREGDTVARLGGDEFVIMLESLSASAEEAAALAQNMGEKILSALNQHYALADSLHHSTPSIGITLFADHLDTVDDLLKRADLAMYQAKDGGRNTLRFFDPRMQATVNARATLEIDLREALRAGQFLPYYQPQVDADGRVTGAEALL